MPKVISRYEYEWMKLLQYDAEKKGITVGELITNIVKDYYNNLKDLKENK